MAVQWPPWSGGGSGGGVAMVNGDAGPNVVIDAADVGAVPQTDVASRVYATDGSGAEVPLAYSQSPNASSIAQRGAAGTLQVGNPTAAAHATRKDYVDGLVNDLDARLDVLETAGFVRSDGSVTDILAKTQAEYDGLTPDPTTHYLIDG